MTIEPQESQAQRGAIPVDSFGNRLMLARAHAGHLSIREAADLCDLGRGAWTNWEKGARPADIIEISTVVAEKLSVDRDWLLFGGGLAQAEGRLPRSGSRVKSTEGYPPVPVLVPLDARPSATRPVSPRPPLQHAASGPGRTSYIPRPRHNKRDR